jgi:glycosyltransferase involved in cell wall biosynthesis
LHAFAEIQRQLPDASLLLVGYGTQTDAILRTARDLGLRNVEYLGKLPPAQSRRLYDRVDVYLCATSIDCFPNSLIEAFASGVPVVTTDAGGIPDLVTHERTGLLVRVGDVEGLASQAVRLFKEGALSRVIIRNAYEEVCSRYVWKTVAAQWEDLFRGLVGRAPAADITTAKGKQQEAIA